MIISFQTRHHTYNLTTKFKHQSYEDELQELFRYFREVFVPINSSFQSFFPADLFSPSKLMQLCGINGVTQIIEIPIRNISNEGIHLILLSNLKTKNY